MDNILSQLRKTTQKVQNSNSERKKETNNKEDDSTILELPSTSEGDSSAVTPFTIMKLDFKRLKCLSGEITVSEILEFKEYKIHQMVVALVKKIEKYSSEICYIELIDETGCIGCSCMYKLVIEHDIKIGSILKVKGVSLWKIEVNHINLVEENIVQIVND